MEEYESLINKLVEEFKETIPEGYENLTSLFKKNLYDYINFSRNNSYEFLSKKENIIRGLNVFASKLISADIETKKRELEEDENFNKIRDISLEGYDAALNILNKKKVEKVTDINQKITKMKKLLNCVKDYNKNVAKELVSEGILDWNYLKNPDTETFSLRIGKKIMELEEGEVIMKKKEEKFLPIGTVVLLKEAMKRVMIVGFCAMQQDDDTIWDYSGCLYPEGVLSSSEMLLFNHDQIDKIYHLGLAEDEEEIEFKKILNIAVQEASESDKPVKKATTKKKTTKTAKSTKTTKSAKNTTKNTRK